MNPLAPNPYPGVPSIEDFTIVQIEIWLLVLLRVSVMVFLLPILNSDEVPSRLKAGLALFLSFLLFPALPSTTLAVPENVFAYVLMAVREIYVGAVMGFAGTFIFAGIRFAGSWIDQEAGFSIMQMFNPVAGEEDTPLGHLLFILFMLLMLATGGYAFYLRAIAESFQVIPLAGARAASADMVAIFTRLSTDAFILGLKVAAPVVTTLFVSSIALAIIARIMPQMNVWMVGMPMKLAMGMLTTLFALPLLWQTFLKEQDSLHAYYLALMRMMRS